MKISYNAPIEERRRRRLDAQAVLDFATGNIEKGCESLLITYDTKKECRNRRMCLKVLIEQHPEWNIYIVERDTRLYIFKNK